MFSKQYYKKRSLIDNFDQSIQYLDNPQEDKDLQSETWFKFNEINMIQMQKEQIQNQKKGKRKYIKSININKITQQLKFEMTDDGSKSWLRHDHIGLPLKIFCDLKHPYDISFSLNPNPQQKVVNDQFPKTQIKWFSIDQQLKKPILQQTKFGQILFKADYMMKILTLGLKQEGQKFKYPQDLEDIFTIDFDLSQQKEISRFFLKVKENSNKQVIILSQDQDFYKLQLQNPIIQVQARNVSMVNGKIIDKPVQDQKSRCYILAQRFSKYYDVIADQYSIFNQLKGAILGLALAKWFQKQKIHISKKFVNQICRQQRLENYQKTLPFIKGTLTFERYNTFRIYQHSIYLIGGFNGHLADSLFSTNRIKFSLQSNNNQYRSLINSQKYKILSSFNLNFQSQFVKSTPSNFDKNIQNKSQNVSNSKNQRKMLQGFQISSPKYYNKFLSKPNHPGLSSGVTIGIGYDIGQNNRKHFQKYWKNHLPNDQYNLLSKSIGLQGNKAKEFIEKNKNQLNKIKIPLETAKIVFNNVIQSLQKDIQNKYPGLRDKYPNTFNSLVSMHYNRGFKTTGKTQKQKEDRRQVKRINDVLTGKSMTTKSIPQFVNDQLIKMNRLWQGRNMDGLVKRRKQQAQNCLKDLKKN